MKRRPDVEIGLSNPLDLNFLWPCLLVLVLAFAGEPDLWDALTQRIAGPSCPIKSTP